MMGRRIVRLLTVPLLLSAMIAVFPGVASAVNATNWVAALYVEAQKTIGLRWTPVPGATAYKVLRSTAAGKDYAEIASVAVPQYFDKDIQPGTTYYYVLQVAAGAEVSPNSQERSVVIPGEKKVEILLPPEWDKVTVSSQTEFGKTTQKVGLYWKSSKGNVAAYNLFRSETPGKDYALIASMRETQQIDAAVEEGKTYYYVLNALDGGTLVETPYSEEKSVKIEVAVVKKAAPKQEKVIQRFKVSSIAWTADKGSWGNLDGPTEVDFNDTEVFVTNFADKNIYVFNRKDGAFIRKFGARSESQPRGLEGPRGLFYDTDDDLIYVGDTRLSRVLVFKPDSGDLVNEIQISKDDGVVYPGEDYQKVAAVPPAPTDISLSPDGDTIAICDNGRSKILLYTKKGKFIKEISKGVGKGEPGTFAFPSRLAFNFSKEHSGDLVVVDSFGSRVQIYDFKTEEWRMFGELGEVAGAFKTPIGLDVDPATNKIYVADKDNFVVTEFDYDGKFLTMLGTKQKNNLGNNILLLGTPIGLRVDGKTKTAYVANYYGGIVYAVTMTDEIFTPEGQGQ